MATSESVGFTPVVGLADLGNWFSRSKEEVVILFLHDPWCPISGRANVEMKQVTYSPIVLIDVSRQKDVTREVQELTGIRHESPQVILIQDGKPIWDASHFSITADAVDRMLGFSSTIAGDES